VTERELKRKEGTDPEAGNVAGEAGGVPGRGSVPENDRIAELERVRDE
jgi:hypothetical protein